MSEFNKTERKSQLKYVDSPSFNKMVKEQQESVLAAAGKIPPDLIFKNAAIVNVFTEELEQGDIAIYKGVIVGVGNYSLMEYENHRETKLHQEDKGLKTNSGPEIVDCTGQIVCPGFIDGHIHIESSMLSPAEFATAVVPHGTTAVITDPHEIVNVAGLLGLDYMLESTKSLPLKVYMMLPSCVPATSMDESGAVLEAKDLVKYMNHDSILGLAELMDFFGTIEAKEAILKKIVLTKQNHKIVDGHAPGLRDYNLNAYIAAGVTSDHECSIAEEALEKLKRGQWIMIREGTAAKNMEALMPLFSNPYYNRCMLVTDDKHPGDLIKHGHMDYLLQKAVENGADPIRAIKMVTKHPAEYFGLKDMGAVAPGYKADLVILENLKEFCVKAVYKEGKLVGKDGQCIKTEFGTGMGKGAKSVDSSKKKYLQKVYSSFHLKELIPEDFSIQDQGSSMRVIELVPGELLTIERILPNPKHGFQEKGKISVDGDIIKLAVVERHHNTGNIGLGYLKGYGLKSGAIASSVAHDSHNLIIAGTNNEDMCQAANHVRKNQGGLAIVCEGKLIGELALPIAGLMCEDKAEQVDEILTFLKKEAIKLGVNEGIDPFMTLAFLSLPVIPEVRLTTRGLVNVNRQEFVKTIFM